jgi:MATE family multidrug resistance protein
MLICLSSANAPERARVVAWQCVILSCVLGLAAAMAMMTFRDSYPLAFTTDHAILELATALLRVCAPFQVACSVYAALMGIFRGAGQQTHAAILNGIAYIGFGLPLGSTIAWFCDNGIVGLWFGVNLAFLAAAIYGILSMISVDRNLCDHRYMCHASVDS